MAGSTYKKSARALQDRRLVKISKTDDSWSAVVTDIGHYYLKHRSFPPKSTALTGKPMSTPSRAKTTAPRHGGTPVRSPRSTSTTQPPRLSATEQLVADVVAAGGVLKRLAESGYNVSHRTSELVRNANRHGKTPPGTRLVHSIDYDGDRWHGTRYDVFVLEDGPAGTDAPLLPVPVPDQVGRYHPAVSALRNAEHITVATAARTRAFRILHAIATEAERRDFTVARPAAQLAGGRSGARDVWHLLLSVGGDTVPLRITEETDRIEHGPTARELAEQKRYSWTRIPSHDHVPSGRLRIEIGGTAQSERKSFWADRASWSLEDKLPELLREVAVRADELRLRRDAKVKAEAEHRQAVEREEERARARAAEAHRHKILEDQLGRWREARELREYVAVVTARVDAAETNNRADAETIADARRWLEWITNQADRRDPVTQLPNWPTLPELRTYELSQFMNHVPEPAAMRYQPESY